MNLNPVAWIMKAMAPTMAEIVMGSLPYGWMNQMQRYGKVPEVDQAALVRRYWGWVYMCANISAMCVCSTPLRLYSTRAAGESKASDTYGTRPMRKSVQDDVRKKFHYRARVKAAEEIEEIVEHPFIDLLASINDFENSWEAMQLTVVMLDLTGNSYWYAPTSQKTGVPESIFVLRSQWTRIMPDAEKYIKGYLYGKYLGSYDGSNRMDAVAFEPDEIVHFKYPNPYDIYYGLGPVQAAAYTIDQDEARQQFINATMGNMGRPDMVVKYTEGELADEDRRKLEAEWNQAFRGPKKAGKIKVADYRTEFEKVGWNPSELNFTAGEEWIMKRICAAFPVPVGLVDSAQISKAPRSGMEGSDLFMAKLNTTPRCKLIEQKLNERLVKKYDERLFVAFDDPVPQNKEFQLQQDASQLATFVTTINEIRQRDGLEDVPWGDVPLAPFGISPLGSAPAGAPPAEAQSIASPDGEQPASSGSSSSGSPGGNPFDDDEDEQPVKMLDGADIHRDLYGLAVKQRHSTRNEGGRYDKPGVNTLRGKPEVAALLVGKKGVKGDVPGHEFRGNQYSDGSGGGGSEAGGGKPDRNSDEASDARYFRAQQQTADAHIASIKDKITENNRKIEAASKIPKLQAELDVARAGLQEVQQRKAAIEQKYKDAMARIAAKYDAKRRAREGKSVSDSADMKQDFKELATLISQLADLDARLDEIARMIPNK